MFATMNQAPLTRHQYKLSKEESSLLRSRLQVRDSSTVARLLYKAGFLAQADVAQAHAIALHLRKSLDEVVLTGAFLNRRHRSEALKAAQFVEGGTVVEELAVSGLAAAISCNLTFEQGLEKHMGWGN